MLNVIEFRYSECHYAECYYSECHYAECHYAQFHYPDCRGTKFTASKKVFLATDSFLCVLKFLQSGAMAVNIFMTVTYCGGEAVSLFMTVTYGYSKLNFSGHFTYG
jgi:hypothetical protein